ncbi:MAG: arylsulfatase [Dehalococcoidia bacterium]
MSVDPEFRGVIGRTRAESTPWWPDPARAPAGAPNVLIVVLDDVGFAQLGCFGSDIETPVLDGLAAHGLRYTNFHTTALCSPTRACVLTGRNHHSAGMGRVADLPTGFPGYWNRIPKSVGFLPEMLVPQGYAAYAVGKWHLVPEDETHLAASRERWPLGRGFERFYGFFGGETNQFAPSLVHDNHHVAPPRAWEDGYHLTEDLADHAVEYLQDLRAADPDKPFFLYFCTGACHSPHQPPPDWREKYRGHFDAGWDAWRDATFARQQSIGLLPPTTELSPRPDWVPAWDSLTDDQRRVFARFQECFAGYLSHADAQIGRVLSFLRETGDLDNTLLLVLSDNGASSEGGPFGSLNDLRTWNLAGTPIEEAVARIDEIGGPYTHNNYPWGWTVAGNTPFRRWKREVHEGGVADPLIVHWPRGLDAKGELRRQYVHAIDLAPTILDIAGIEAPAEIAGVAQKPIEGVSFAHTLRDAAAQSQRDTQYFEMLGCRAIYHNGWKAVVYHPIFDPNVPFDDTRWELYDVTRDASECHDLAQQEPARLKELIELWWREAEKYQVLPLDNSPFEAIFGQHPTALPARGRYVYYPGGGLVPEVVAANVRNRSHTITAEVEVPPAGAEGVLLANGSGLGGYVLFVKDGRLHYVHNFCAFAEHRVVSDIDVPAGEHTLSFRFVKEGEHKGTGTLYIDDLACGSVHIDPFTRTRFAITGDGLSCGYGAGLAICKDYRSPFAFTGRLRRVVIDVEGPAFVDPRTEAELAITSQ